MVIEARMIDLTAQEGLSVADFLQSRIHKTFTEVADDLCSLGYLDTETRIAVSGAIGKVLDLFRQKMAEVGVDQIEMDRDLARELVLKAAKRADMEELALKVLNELDLHIGDLVEYNQENTMTPGIGEIVGFTSDYRAKIMDEYGTTKEVPVVRILQKKAVYMRPPLPSGGYAPLSEEAIEGTGKIGNEEDDLKTEISMEEVEQKLRDSLGLTPEWEEYFANKPPDLGRKIHDNDCDWDHYENEYDFDEEKEGAGRSYDPLRTIIEAGGHMFHLTPKQVAFNIRMKELTGQLPKGYANQFHHDLREALGQLPEQIKLQPVAQAQQPAVRIETVDKSSSASWTYVFSNMPLNQEYVQAAVNMTDGDYNMQGNDTLIIYHRTIPGEQRTQNIAQALQTAGANVLRVLHRGNLVEPPYSKWAQSTESDPYPDTVVELSKQDRFEIYDTPDVILEDQQADPANWDSQFGWDQTMSESEQADVPLIRPGHRHG